MTRTGRRAGVWVVALSASTMLLVSGCSARDAAVKTTTAPTVASSALVASLPAAKKAVGDVTWALVEGEPRSLVPGADYNFVAPNLCESLLRLQPDFSVAPGVATKADWTDPTTFVIDLRPGVKFWDGTAVTADDVVFSLERNKDVTSPFYGAFVLVKSIQATGKRQVTVRFNAPDSTFRDAMTGGAGAVLSRSFSRKAGAKLGTADGGLLCTGPFMLEKWTPGDAIVTVANKDYWGGAPLVQKLTYKFISDGTTLTNALLQGDVDGAFTVPPASRRAFESSSKGRLVLGPSTASLSFGPTRSKGAGANPKIRQALSLAIDRKQYIQTVLNGLGQPQRTFVAPFSWSGQKAADVYAAGYKALAQPKYDLDAARKLVKESGVDTSVPLRIATPAGSKELAQTAAIVQSAGRQIGLTIEIDERQAADYAAIFGPDPGPRANTDFVAATGYTETPGVLTYPQLFLLPPAKGGIFNWSGYANPRVSGPLMAARTTPDPVAAAKAYVAAQRIFAPDQLQVTLAGAYHTTFLSNRLTGAVTSVAAYASPWALHLGGK